MVVEVKGNGDGDEELAAEGEEGGRAGGIARLVTEEVACPR